jgi:hypothetical protein
MVHRPLQFLPTGSAIVAVGSHFEQILKILIDRAMSRLSQRRGLAKFHL